jgi:hypothetical protein
MVMSTDVNRVGVALSFYIFLSFHLSRFSFYINNTGKSYLPDSCHANTVAFISCKSRLTIMLARVTSNIVVSLLIQLMKVLVLAESSWFLCFHFDLSTLCSCLQTSVR